MTASLDILRTSWSVRSPEDHRLGWQVSGVNRDCANCGARFEARLERRLFCSDVCRVRYNREHELKCFYCGDLATARDHVFPHSSELPGERQWGARDIVNACSECNAGLSDKYGYWLHRRIKHLIDWTIKRYQLDEMIPEWADEELDELGYALRASITFKIKQRQRALDRVIHMNVVLRRIILDYPDL